MVILIWVTIMLQAGIADGRLALVGIGGLVWCATTVPLLLQYRHRDDTSGALRSWRSLVAPLLITIVFGVVAGVATGLWAVGALPIAQSLILLNWPRGVRVRLIVLMTAVLTALWAVDFRTAVEPGLHTVQSWWLVGFFSVLLPVMSVLSLWWWDVLVLLDRARAAEARLGATQERLRMATDVHDLQGHHLQVIALQLELAERLMPQDPDTGMEQLRAARGSVDEARQGTRDLATRYRSVPLRDERSPLTDRELDVLRAGRRGETTGQIARSLSLAPGTVRNHVSTILGKLGVGTRQQAILLAEERGWI